MGYFIYDFLAMAYYRLLDGSMTIHHTMVLFGYGSCLLQKVGANYGMIGIYATEVSNPVMHIRNILRHLGMRYTKAYETMEISFMMLYFYGRLLIGVSCVWNAWLCPVTPFVIKVSALGILIQSFFFIN